MSVVASGIGAGWRLICEPARRRMVAALQDPQRAQQLVLARLLAAAEGSAFAMQHDLQRVKTVRDFRQALPVGDYESHRPWIERLRHETNRNVLTGGEVDAFERSSGSTSACKYLPFNAALRGEFTEAVRAWMADLFDRHPQAMRGPAWWLVSPLRPEPATASGIRVGLSSDDEYLGWWERRLSAHLLAVPGRIASVADIDECMDLTLRCLLHTPELRLISVWNASYLTLLWERLLARGDRFFSWLAEGGQVLGRRLPALPDRAKQLRALWEDDALTPAAVWPNLAVLSAWDGPEAKEAAALFSQASFQTKGLLATEGVITIPWGSAEGSCVPALNSHFLEFEDAGGEVLGVEELEPGAEYGILLTTGGGLWRYRLGDQVRAESLCGATCRLRFIGRMDGVSDLRGEKLHPQFVAEVLGRLPVEFAMLALDGDRYTLFASSGEVGIARQTDMELCANPHYALCRANGQLGAVRLFHVREDGRAACLRRALKQGGRPGTMKTMALSRLSDWERWFEGAFVGDAA